MAAPDASHNSDTDVEPECCFFFDLLLAHEPGSQLLARDSSIILPVLILLCIAPRVFPVAQQYVALLAYLFGGQNFVAWARCFSQLLAQTQEAICPLFGIQSPAIYSSSFLPFCRTKCCLLGSMFQPGPRSLEDRLLNSLPVLILLYIVPRSVCPCLFADKTSLPGLDVSV